MRIVGGSNAIVGGHDASFYCSAVKAGCGAFVVEVLFVELGFDHQ